MSDTTISKGFKYRLRQAWYIAKFALIVLAILTFVSCSYWLDHLRFTV